MAKFIQQEMPDLNNTGKKQTYYRMDVKQNIDTKEQRWQKAVEYLSDPAHPVMRLDDYVRLTGVSRSVASRELREYYDLPDSQISTFGRGTSKVYVKRNMDGESE